MNRFGKRPTWRGMLQGFPLIMSFSVPFADIDMMQHVNNAAHIRWLETLRAEYFAQVMQTPINGERGMIQANIQFTYERQLSYRERIAVGCKIPRIGTKSFDFAYEVWSETHGKRAAHGKTAMVAWRDAIEAFEKGPQRRFH